MTRSFQLAIVLGLGLVFMAQDVEAHGGSYRGPPGGVPPGLREPTDPEPPPPPPSDPGDPGGPITPGDGPGGPTTPDGGVDTPGDSPAPAPTPTPGTGRKAPTTKALTFESWRFWWGYNNDDILNVKSHIYANRASSSSPLHFASRQDANNVRNAQRPTARAVQKQIIPALLATINRKGDHEDIHGGALVAMGKLGTARNIDMFQQALLDKFKNTRGQKIEFGPQAKESAVLALGILPNMDAASKETIRRICLDALDNEKLATRERAWAAVCLGLQRDDKAVRPLIERLDKKYADGNIPAGILCGLGLIGDGEHSLEGLMKGFEKSDLFGKRVTDDRIKAFIGYAIMKLGDPRALDSLIKIISSRRTGRVVKRSAAIAIGVLGAKTEDTAKKDMAVQALLKYIRKSGGDSSGENFAIIGLSQIASDKAIATLLDIAESGRYSQRPFAGLGLGTYVFYNDRDHKVKMAPELRKKIVTKLAKLSDKYKDPDTKAAFLLARGLCKDKTMVEDATKIAAKRSANPVLRGFACVALGLVGNTSDNVKNAMKLALKERKSVDLRRDAATGLALLRDAEVVKLLLEELKRAKSFAVQGQLITAIGTIGDHTAIDPLVKILDDTNEPAQTRAMAAVGLGMIGDLQELPALSRLSKNYNYRASAPDIDELLFIL